MLTEEQIKQVGNFDQATIDAIRVGLGGEDSMSAAGAITLKTFLTKLVVSGTMAFTLANGTVIGQRKKIVCESAAATPLGTVTIATPETATGHACAAAFTFNQAGQSIELLWTGTKWRCVRVQRAGVLAVVVGTTVLTGLSLNLNYALSVTGTVSSTGTKALPNGSSVGERIVISNPTAALTPIGNINFAGLTLLGVAATDIGAVGANTDTAILEWDGTAWQVLYQVGLTIA